MKYWHEIVFVISVFVLISTVAFAPQFVDDSNVSLKKVVEDNLLDVLGVILAITLASIAHIHFSLLSYERKISADFSSARHELKQSAIVLIGVYAASFAVLISKGWWSGDSFAIAVCNSLLILGVVVFLLVMADIIEAVLTIR